MIETYENIMDFWISLHIYKGTCYDQFQPNHPERNNGECDITYLYKSVDKENKNIYIEVRQNIIINELFTDCVFMDKYTFNNMIINNRQFGMMSNNINDTASELFHNRKDMKDYLSIWLNSLALQFKGNFSKLNRELQTESVYNNLNNLYELLSKTTENIKSNFVLPIGYCFKNKKYEIFTHCYDGTMESLIIILFNEKNNIMKDYKLCVILDEKQLQLHKELIICDD